MSRKFQLGSMFHWLRESREVRQCVSFLQELQGLRLLVCEGEGETQLPHEYCEYLIAVNACGRVPRGLLIYIPQWPTVNVLSPPAALPRQFLVCCNVASGKNVPCFEKQRYMIVAVLQTH